MRIRRSLTLQRASSPLLFLALLAFASAVPARAQQGRTIRTLTVGPSAVNFDDYGGSIGAAVAWFSLARVSERLLGSEGAFFMMVPLGGASAVPDCIPQQPCQTRSTPSVLYGALVSGLANAGQGGLRAAFGLGAVGASGGEGLENRSSITGHVGLDWVARGSGKYVLTVTARLLLLASPIAGARQVFLPGIGVTF